MTGDELVRVRIALLQAFLRLHECDGILLSRIDNFAMATGGRRNHVSIATDVGAYSLFVTKTGAAYFIGNNIEATRAMDEELAGLNCGAYDFPWYEGSASKIVTQEFTGNFVSDDGSIGENVHGKLAYLRALLTPLELEKYRRLGTLAAEAISDTLDKICAGTSESEIASTLISEGARRGCTVTVSLVAADDRIAKYRHPLPTRDQLVQENPAKRTVRNYVMVVGGFLREGLVASVTRFKCVAELPNETQDAYGRICAVDALLQEATVPGATLGEVFEKCRSAYKDMGFVQDEWHNHHQGGATGYAGRTCKGAPGERFRVLDDSWTAHIRDITGQDIAFGHAFAWNPSARGVKSEDTFILHRDGNQEIVTATPSFPEVDLERYLGRTTNVFKSGIRSK